MKISEQRKNNLEATRRYLTTNDAAGNEGNSKLDASLKKNSTMANKLKTVTADNAQKLCDELKKLNFSKFIAEFVSSLAESALKSRNSNDIAGILEVASGIHQRTSEFAIPFLLVLLKLLLPYSSNNSTANTSTDKPENAQQRAALRVISEFVANGFVDGSVFVGKNSILPAYQAIQAVAGGEYTMKDILAMDGGVVYCILHQYLKDDKNHDNSFLATSFAKFYSADYMGAPKPDEESVIPPTIRKLMTELFKGYFDSVAKRLVSEHKLLKKATTYTEDYQMTRGNLTDQQKARFEAITKSHEQVTKLATLLSECLGYPMPNLPQSDEKKDEFSAVVVNTNAKASEIEWYKTPWEDEEMQSFYCDIPDLINYVNPAALSENKKKKKKKKERKRTEDEDLDDDFYDYVDDDILEQADKNADLDEEVSISGPPVNSALENILLSLPDLINRNLLDQAVIDFCNALESNREEAISRLISTFVSVSRYRTDVLPYYARFIASIHKYISEVGNTVVACLYTEFKKRYRKQGQFNLEHRIKNVKFLGELLKFGVCPTHVIFYCFKRTSQPEASGSVFAANHAIVSCSLLEACGRYMSRTPEIAKKWVPIVDIFEKKCKTSHLESHILMMVENALLCANPPPPKDIHRVEKQRTPLELFVRKLIYNDLTRKNIDNTIALLRKLPWDKPVEMELWNPKPSEDESEEKKMGTLNVRSLLLKIFTKIWKVRFNQVECMADILAGLHKYHPDFGIEVTDDILEQIRNGMEDYNDFQYQQRRVALVRYLGELYNYRLASTATIFDTLYSFLIFGQLSGRVSKTEANPLDGPDDFFRARLVSELLESCGHYLGKGKSGKALDMFLVYFQYYLFTKNLEGMPLDIKFAIDDVFYKLRPRLVRLENLDEAEQQVAEMEKTAFGFSFLDDEHGSKDFMDDDEDIEEQAEPHVVEIPKGPTKEEEMQFAKEYQDLLSDSMSSRKNEKKVALDVVVPLGLNQESVSKNNSRPSKEANVIKFRVLAKGKSTGTIEVPAHSGIAVSSLSHLKELKKEQAQLKDRVLAIQKRSVD